MDEYYMGLAINLAKLGLGKVNPNPLVGAVIVKNSRIISDGYHKEYGAFHAERDAINNAKEELEGATLYVNLEPCCHYGKTPPCTEAIIENKIKRVVVGSLDPNPLVAGRGIKILEEAGIEVKCGVLKEECDKLNEVFFNFIKTKKPYVVMKYAMTMDGKIACHTGKSRWVTGELARKKVHEDRKKYMGIMVGIGTVLEDDPILNCRCNDPVHPIRIICDSKLRIALDSTIVKTAHTYKTIIVTRSKDEDKIKKLEEKSCQILVQENTNDNKGKETAVENNRVASESIDLNLLMDQLADMGIDSILLEGGASLNWSALDSGIVKKVQVYIGPKIFGGKGAKSPIAGLGVDDPQNSFRLSEPEISLLGQDILLESEVLPCLQE